jgi:hypothetical protein
MAEKKNDSSFTVTDRRHFTTEGEVRGDVPEKEESRGRAQEEERAAQPSAPATPPSPIAGSNPPAHEDREVPPPPTAAEQQAQKDAFDVSARQIDQQLEQEMKLRGRSLQEFEVSFERFIASLYMSALMQLGLMHE